MTYRERYQYILTFLADAVALIIAVSLSKMIFDIWLNLVLAGVEPRAYLQFYLILAQTFLIGFLCFNQEEDITCRSFRAEVFRSLRMTLLMGAGVSLPVVASKRPLLDTRCFFLGTLLINFILQPVFHTVIKYYLKANW